MKRATVRSLKNTSLFWQASMPEEELNKWLETEIKNGSFGKLERTIPQSVCSEEELSEALELFPEVIDETGFISPALARLPQTFEVIIEDITAQVEQEKINAEALAFLAETDWLIIRELDCGIMCPVEIKIARQEARQRIIK